MKRTRYQYVVVLALIPLYLLLAGRHTSNRTPTTTATHTSINDSSNIDNESSDAIDSNTRTRAASPLSVSSRVRSMSSQAKHAPVSERITSPAAANNDNEAAPPVAAVDIVWQIPDARTIARPIGIILLFHGCSHDADDWRLLPMERSIWQQSLRTGFALIAMSSLQAMAPMPSPKCWHNGWPPSYNDDINNILPPLARFLSRENLTNIPLFGMGGSSGGSFVTAFSRALRLTAQVVQISPGYQPALRHNDDIAIMPPPTAFVYMHRDTQWASKENIAEARQILQQNGVTSVSYECQSRRLTPSLLSDYIPSLSVATSKQFYGAAADGGYIDKAGYLVDDPRQVEPHMKILDQLGGTYDDNIRASVGELMNMLWAAHELTDEHVSSYLAWFKTFL